LTTRVGLGRESLDNAPGSIRPNGTPDLRPLLINYVRSRGGDTTIAALLGDPVAGPFVRGLTLGELVGDVRSRPAKTQASTALGAPSAKRREPKATTRTAKGRGDYDANVLAAAGHPVAADEVIKKVGGTGLQFRTATKRLLAARKIKRTGKARGTRYLAT
jgi:hypothetical protein